MKLRKLKIKPGRQIVVALCFLVSNAGNAGPPEDEAPKLNDGGGTPTLQFIITGKRPPPMVIPNLRFHH
jgi:hypothetical protein